MNSVKSARSQRIRSVKQPLLDEQGSGACTEGAPATPLVIATGVFNILVPLFFLLFAWEHAAALVKTLRISSLLILVKVVLDLQYCVRRSTGAFVSTSAYAWLIALGGAVMPLFFFPVVEGSDFYVGTLLQLAGLALQIQIIRTLGAGSGLPIARRGVRRDGLYRFVRHPFHLAFIISHYGYVLNHTTVLNLCVFGLVTLLQVLRIREEERLLAEDTEFQAYTEQTRWRALPGVF